MSAPSSPEGPVCRALAFATLAFVGTCLVPYSSLTLIGPCLVVVLVLGVWRERAWSRWHFALLAAAGAFAGSAVYTLFTDVFHMLSEINLQARESARVDRLFQLGLHLDPDRMPILFLSMEWVGGACFLRGGIGASGVGIPLVASRWDHSNTYRIGAGSVGIVKSGAKPGHPIVEVVSLFDSADRHGFSHVHGPKTQ